MGIPLIALLALAVSCGGGHSKKIQYGQTTEASLLEIEGEPESVQALKHADGKMLIYKQDKKFQVESGVVVSSFTDPVEDQKTLLFWKHKFKDCLTTDVKTSGEADAKERTLSCDEQGTSVIYSEGTGFVLRVVEHAKK